MDVGQGQKWGCSAKGKKDKKLKRLIIKIILGHDEVTTLISKVVKFVNQVAAK
jgi:hypothetical protein